MFTIARGTSDAVAAYAAYRLTPALNLPVGSFAPSLASLDGARPQGGGLWTLSISQSARSPDLIAAQAAFVGAGGVRLALVNDVTAPLAAGADIVLDQSAGEEKSIAATKSFACSLLAVDLLAQALSGRGDAAEARCAAIAKAVQERMEAKLDLSLLESVEAAYVIGRGPSLPIATEAALKLKETSGLHAEAVSAAEVMHGPARHRRQETRGAGFRRTGACGRVGGRGVEGAGRPGLAHHPGLSARLGRGSCAGRAGGPDRRVLCRFAEPRSPPRPRSGKSAVAQQGHAHQLSRFA